MTYYFSIINDYLVCTNSRKTIISDAINHHVAHFTFDSRWIGYNKTVTFTNRKTGVSTGGLPLDVDNNCIIPFEPLVPNGEDNYLDVCVKGNLNTETFYTYMELYLLIEKSGKTDYSNPLPPTQSVYDQIVQIASDKYVDAIVGSKTVHANDWQVSTDIFPITSIVSPIIITGTTVTLRTGTFDDYLDRVSYPYTDFYMDYSLDGITMSRVVATSESGASPTLRKIIFTIGANAYEFRVTPSSLTIRRTSGTTAYYLHQVLLRFDDYFYYDYTISGFTTKYQAWLYLEDSSKDAVRGISFKRYPTTSNGYIRLNFSQRPSEDMSILHRALKTDEDLPYAIWMNTEGDVIYKDIIPEPISNDVAVYDNYMCTVGQIKEYINNILI